SRQRWFIKGNWSLPEGLDVFIRPGGPHFNPRPYQFHLPLRQGAASLRHDIVVTSRQRDAAHQFAVPRLAGNNNRPVVSTLHDALLAVEDQASLCLIRIVALIAAVCKNASNSHIKFTLVRLREGTHLHVLIHFRQQLIELSLSDGIVVPWQHRRYIIISMC